MEFKVYDIITVIPVVNTGERTNSLLIIDLTGVFSDENEVKSISCHLSGEGVNSVPYTTLLSFIFGNKEAKSSTGYLHPKNLVLYLINNKAGNKNTYDIRAINIK
ncbi:hypothetical protein [Xenorhabdus bovienii]|uniref:hypothetical protein n=1 Tax=Xenorhabdus bovienii TaxID=40576 RepID=UPI0023B3597B|nr:hypothetical protein [Xenorhabdus bovienii]MDE9553685.1 hypothetical protein [Xenorhabdus bovienii]